MAELRELLETRRGEKSFDDWTHEINTVVKPVDEDRMRVATLYSYLNGNRNIAGKGAKLLAQYFYQKGDYEAVDAISRVILGVPNPAPQNGI